MAFSSYTLLNANTDKFSEWFDKTNQLIGDMSNNVVSEGNNNPFDITIGGVISSTNAVFVGSELSGGEWGSPTAFNISSNATFTNSNTTFSSNTTANFFGDVNITGPTKTVVIDVSNTVISSTDFTIDTDAEITGALTTVDVTGNSATFEAGTFTQLTANDLSVDTLTINGSNAESLFVQTSGDETIDGIKTFSNTSVFTTTVNGTPAAKIYKIINDNTNAPALIVSGDGESDDVIAEFRANANGAAVDISNSAGSSDAIMTLYGDGDLSVEGTITANGDVDSTSDIRLKENIKTIDNALNKTVQLRGVYFNRLGETDKKIGVIAQEVEQILPEVVHKNPNGIRTVSYGNMVGILIEAIKDLDSKMNILQIELDQLRDSSYK